MPIKFRCYQCNKLLATKDGTEGRTFACPDCNAGLLVPGDAPLDIDLEFPVVEARDEPSRPTLRRMPREPWYYTILSFWAWFWVVLGIAQFVFAVCVVAGGTHMFRQDLGGGLFLLVWSGLILFFTALGNAWTLIAVDAARNLRALRYGQ